MPLGPRRTGNEDLEPHERAIIECFARQSVESKVLPILSLKQILGTCGSARHELMRGLESLEARGWLFRAPTGALGDDIPCVLLSQGAALALGEAQRIREEAGRP